MSSFATAFAITAIVLVVSPLLSGVIDRAPLNFPVLFLALGGVLAATGTLSIGAHDPTLELLATVTLALVLFLDAVRLQFGGIGREAWVPVLSLGPGTFLVIGATALLAKGLLGLDWLPALILGTVLASTDPVVLRDVVRDERIPRPVRRALSIEAGTNDIVVLPLLLVLLAIHGGSFDGLADGAGFAAEVFVLGPLTGFAVGGLGSWLMANVDERFPVRREHQALYGVGLVLASYAAGVAVGGDGFLAAFAGGAAVVILDRELCDCFLEFGETTAEMAMLLTFVLFGAVLYDVIGGAPLAASLLLAAVAIVVVRPAAIALVLWRLPISRRALAFIAWFGPRGLNSLLLALLVLLENGPESDRLLAVTGIVVVASVILHGATATPLAGWYERSLRGDATGEERAATALELFDPAAAPGLAGIGAEEDAVPRVVPAELAAMIERGEALVLDVRSRASYGASDARIPGSQHVRMDDLPLWIRETGDPGGPVITYCSCRGDASAAHAAAMLRREGLDARVLAGGFDGWRAEQEVAPKGAGWQPATGDDWLLARPV